MSKNKGKVSFSFIFEVFLVFLISVFLFLLVLIGVKIVESLDNTSKIQDSSRSSSAKNKYNLSKMIGFVGDSITYGVGGSPNATQVSTRNLGDDFYEINRGENGTTSEDWAKDDRKKIKSAADYFSNNHVEVVSLMLGSNDAKKGISPKSYKENIQEIISALRESGAKRVVLHQPPYAPYYSDSQNRSLCEYSNMLDELVDGDFVIEGDRKAYDYFKNHPKQTTDGLHPNSEGYFALGKMWADSLIDLY